ncbi:MAG: PAAR domain-containing protein [Dehalococcoidia bacterium]|nr:PAAR domain-containing protein [Dehalococcoidia bacterium]
MPQPAAKQGDRVTGVCSHLIQPPGPTSPMVTPGHVFNGILSSGLSTDVFIEGRPAAIVGSEAINTPVHIPIGGTFVSVPLVTNRATITMGSSSVFINGRQAARAGDKARTCDEIQIPGTVVATSTVLIGP